MLITLKPRDDRDENASQIIRRIEEETRNVRGISIAMQPVQDLTIDSTVGRAQYLFFLENPNQSQFSTWVPRLVAADAGDADLRGRLAPTWRSTAVS